MKVNGIEGLSLEEMQSLVQQGAKFVMYEYAISILIMTFKRSSDVYFVKADENAIVKGLGFTAISLLFGWWGFPWGIIATPIQVTRNLGGLFSRPSAEKPSKALANILKADMAARRPHSEFFTCPRAAT